jgi:hypothetical protein
MASPFVGASEARQGSGQRYRYRAERHTQHLGNLAVGEALRPQRKACPILFGKSLQNAQQTNAPLVAGALVFGIGRAVYKNTLSWNLDALQMPLTIDGALFQSQIVGHLKDPGTKIVPGPAELQVLEERKKHFLHDLFAIRDLEAEAQQITEQPPLQLIEQTNHLLFERSLPCLRNCGWPEAGNDFVVEHTFFDTLA